MARRDNQQSNSGGRDSELQGKSAGSRGTPGDYSDPNARQGSSRSGQGSDSSRNQIANDDDDDETYGTPS